MPLVMQWSDSVVFPKMGGHRKLFTKFRWVILFRLNGPVSRREEGFVTAIHEEIFAIPEADMRCALGLTQQVIQLPGI
jgi:hypothetical protein